MTDKLSINEIYDKNISFLIGSGASYGLFPTLALDIKNERDEGQTVETLATLFEQKNEHSLYTLLFMHYYKECIEPVMLFDLEEVKNNQDKKKSCCFGAG